LPSVRKKKTGRFGKPEAAGSFRRLLDRADQQNDPEFSRGFSG